MVDVSTFAMKVKEGLAVVAVKGIDSILTDEHAMVRVDQYLFLYKNELACMKLPKLHFLIPNLN